MHIYIVDIMTVSLRVMTLAVSLSLSLLAELPYGWEKVNDPVYGTYYIE